MKTKKMIAVIGVCEGYSHNNQFNDNIEKIYMGIAKAVYNLLGIYVSAVIKEVKTCYNEDWGCPESGELTYEISAVANPKFIKDMDLWYAAVTSIIRILKEELKQSTVVIEFSDVDILYLEK